MSTGTSLLEITTITIEDATRHTALASGELGKDVIIEEGSYYFDREKVDLGNLQITERLYTCPYKGVCNWIDLVDENGKVVKEVGWVYPTPKKDYEHIAGRIAFYPGVRRGTIAKLEKRRA